LLLNGERDTITAALKPLVTDGRVFEIKTNGVKRYTTKKYKTKKQSPINVDENITAAVEEKVDDQE